MNQEDTIQDVHEPEHDKTCGRKRLEARRRIMTKIADLQRMNVEQLNHFARNIGLKNLGALAKSQIVFEIVKYISEKPEEILVGEGVLEVLPDGFGFLALSQLQLSPFCRRHLCLSCSDPPLRSEKRRYCLRNDPLS